MPPELRDSGLSSHCAVSINRTHVVIVGGYAADHYIDPPFGLPDVYVPGLGLNKTWMYDGNAWENMPDMHEVRDRPACSLLQLDNGEIRILVAGGW